MESPDQLNLMRRVTVAMLVVGGTECAIGVWMVQRTPFSQAAQGVIAATFVLCGLLLLVLPTRLALIQFAVVFSVALLGALMAVSDRIGMASSFYLWPVVFAAYFFPPRHFGLLYGWAMSTLVVGLVLNSTESLKLDTFMGTVSTVGLMAALVAIMNRRESALRARLAAAANTDALTGLLNRRAFTPALEALVASASATHAPLSVVLFDVDFFKRFNDEHGHLAGDDALVRLAAVLTAQSRAGDLVARFGGEEFAVVLPGAGLEEGRGFADRVVAALREPDPSWPGMSVSAGVAAIQPGVETIAALLKNADDALYAAKAAGRGRAAWWDRTIQVGRAAELV